MVYVTGDCHADYRRFSIDNFPEQKEMTRDDVVIVCGDFGIWNDSNSERWWFNWLAEKPFTIAFVDGNHENFDRLYSDEFPVVDFHGGKAHQIHENIFHLMRGYVFTFEGKKFFAFGGAQSHDISDGILDPDNFKSIKEFKDTYYDWFIQGKMFRVNHQSWWSQELPSQEEMDFGLQQLSNVNNKVDFIISHCCPQEIALLNGYHGSDCLTQYFDTIAHNITFDKWYYGHYHEETITYSKFICLYGSITRIL